MTRIGFYIAVMCFLMASANMEANHGTAVWCFIVGAVITATLWLSPEKPV